MRDQVFVAYSHQDQRFLARLRVHLRRYERTGQLDVWSDLNLRPGDAWRDKIREVIDRCKIAILLVSADFLASDFIADNELPPLLERAQTDGVRIIPVIVRPCAFVRMPELARFQAGNNPARPLARLNDAAREDVWDYVGKSVTEILDANPVQTARSRPGSSAFQNDDGPAREFQWQCAYGFDELAFVLGTPEDIQNLFVYQYHFLDYLEYAVDAQRVFANHSRKDDYLRAVKERFQRAGWEGDGVIQFIWLPPFIGVGVEDTHGALLWHVKQLNNGTSWLASYEQLPFGRLLEQNDPIEP